MLSHATRQRALRIEDEDNYQLPFPSIPLIVHPYTKMCRWGRYSQNKNRCADKDFDIEMGLYMHINVL